MGNSKRSRTVTLLLVLLPLWLVGSGGGALWYYFHKEKKQALVEQERFAQAVSVPLIADDLRKIVEVIGERNPSSEAAAANLRRTASMIEGLLGPSNTGYTVRKTDGPVRWPILQVTVNGSDPTAPGVIVLAAYDSRPGSRGAEMNASGLAATIAAAQALARDKPRVHIDFVFLAHSVAGEALSGTTVAEFVEVAGKPKHILVVEAMGGGETLWLSFPSSGNDLPTIASGIGSVYDESIANPAGETEFAARLAKAGLPVIRVSTRAVPKADEKDDRLPFAPTVAASAGRLIELIRRCAEK